MANESSYPWEKWRLTAEDPLEAQMKAKAKQSLAEREPLDGVWPYKQAPTAPHAPKADMKPRGVKPPLHLIPFAPIKWAARIFQFGNSPGKYERGNWKLGKEGESPLQKSQEYFRAAAGHLWAQMEHAEFYLELKEGEGPGGPTHYPFLARDDEEGGSRGPHLAHALCSLIMGIAVLVYAGLAPDDPGKTWEKDGV